MSQFTEALILDVTQRYPHLFPERHETGGETAAHEVPFAAMVLDRLGTVRYCHADAARLFGASAHTLVGRHVTELIPDLPFKPRTPGYNVAYAAFWAPDGSRRGFCGVDNEGRSFGLQIALDRLELEKHHQILLSLRLPAESAQLPERFAGSGNDVDMPADRADIPASAE